MLRLEIRYSLFAQRDILRSIRLENNSTLSNDLYYTMEDSICNTIKRLPQFTLSTKIKADIAYENNVVFKNKINKIVSLINETEDERIIKINHDVNNLTDLTIILNSGGWLYILLPIVLIILIFGLITNSIKKIRDKIFNPDTIVFAGDNDLSNFAV